MKNVVENDDYYDEDEDEYISYEDWYDGYYETYSTRCTSPSGDKLVILCKHGWD